MTYMSEQQNLETATTAEPAAVPLINEIALHAPEQQYRAGAYSLLAALLRDVPTAEVLKQAAGMSELAQDKDDLGLAMSMLGLAAQHSDPASVDDEYHDLFIGLGRGEVVPYGSWYDDLSKAESASFYQAVARFGAAFIKFEHQYFGLDIKGVDA